MNACEYAKVVEMNKKSFLHFPAVLSLLSICEKPRKKNKNRKQEVTIQKLIPIFKKWAKNIPLHNSLGSG